MSSFTPCFPPVILEKCLDIAKYIAQKKTGRATLEVNLGSSRFSFSCDNSSGFQTGSSRQDQFRKNKKTKKKLPSDRKRDARRLEKFLEEKRNSSHPAASSLQPSTNISTSNLSLISETPMINEEIEVMETDSPKISSESIPVIDVTRNATVEDSQQTPDNAELINVPTLISPINSPSKPDPPKIEEVHVMICASDQETAAKFAKKLPRSSFLGFHVKNPHHHFKFKIHLNQANLMKMKADVNSLAKLPKDVHMIFFLVLSENLKYKRSGAQKNEHCPECENRQK